MIVSQRDYSRLKLTNQNARKQWTGSYLMTEVTSKGLFDMDKQMALTHLHNIHTYRFSP